MFLLILIFLLFSDIIKGLLFYFNSTTMPENQSSDFSLDSLMNTSNTPENNSSLESSLSF